MMMVKKRREFRTGQKEEDRTELNIEIVQSSKITRNERRKKYKEEKLIYIQDTS